MNRSRNITVYKARSIITMNPIQPRATHVAVCDGRILGVGDEASLVGWGPAEFDDTFADKVLMPGLVEGHCHLLEGGMWNYVYVGYYDRRGPDGRLWQGLKSFDEVIARLQEAESKLENPADPVYAWGFDPIYFGSQRMTVEHLNRVSESRRVVVIHASAHLMNINSAMLREANITKETAIEGVVLNADGDPTGEMQEFPAMYLVYRKIGNIFFDAGQTEKGIWNFGKVAQLSGVTTATDLVSDLGDASIENLLKVTALDEYPLRIVPAYAPMRDLDHRALKRVLPAIKRNTEKLHFGIVKLVVDGSIQGFTARLRWPGYYDLPDGASENGIWIIPPGQIEGMIKTYHDAGLTVHIHTNGDEATEATLDAIEAVLKESPRWDHRHTLQHCQMADAYQFRRMSNMGLCVNLFANHIYYWGDVHYNTVMGPDRANRMDAAASAKANGVHFSLHSDAPITPLAPLFTAWCAVNRKTASGRVLGEGERIPVLDALRAVTLGAAYTLKLDHKIGSIEVGKQADFAVLEDDPLELAPEALKDVRVWGTVLGGKVFVCPKHD